MHSLETDACFVALQCVFCPGLCLFALFPWTISFPSVDVTVFDFVRTPVSFKNTANASARFSSVILIHRAYRTEWRENKGASTKLPCQNSLSYCELFYCSNTSSAFRFGRMILSPPLSHACRPAHRPLQMHLDAVLPVLPVCLFAYMFIMTIRVRWSIVFIRGSYHALLPPAELVATGHQPV